MINNPLLLLVAGGLFKSREKWPFFRTPNALSFHLTYDFLMLSFCWLSGPNSKSVHNETSSTFTIRSLHIPVARKEVASWFGCCLCHVYLPTAKFLLEHLNAHAVDEDYLSSKRSKMYSPIDSFANEDKGDSQYMSPVSLVFFTIVTWNWSQNCYLNKDTCSILLDIYVLRFKGPLTLFLFKPLGTNKKHF